MPNDAADNGFQSVLAPFMDQFVRKSTPVATATTN